MFNVVIAIVLFAHGIGHVMGPVQVFKVATINPAWTGDSWLLTGMAGQPIAQAIGVTLWTAALVGFVLLAGVVLGWLPAAWWGPLAVGSSLISIAAIVLFPMAFPVGSVIGALAVDVVVLLAALWFHWTPTGVPA